MANDSSENTVRLVPGKSDFELAMELREEISAAARPLLLAMNKAKDAGFVVGIQIAANPAGQWVRCEAQLVKHF